ncbi:hypothetical protein HCH44_03255 [Sphingomonas melonis]|jgi:hypothetical protein|uniref:hypothetical protein n=1 Tax=Sphingomonas TaxID=13687 RepID=UPI0012DD51B5|nr:MULTISPECIES: hypothetical protein [Sphingomonas]MBX8843920.1 hypothetical protein [Sphingomonas melonis]MBX8853542.1 hypothetical protein [Sphingomonas melonis]MBX8898496.1 hypothetical protein [Sphingomonas melonis]MCP4026087.1 hypothetical protein [Sphingomonas sp.]
MGLALVLMTAGCATDRGEKPLLTARTSQQMARACGAIRSEFHRNAPGLPYATFVLKVDEAVPQDAPPPTVKCLSEALHAFRHSMLSFRAEEAGNP